MAQSEILIFRADVLVGRVQTRRGGAAQGHGELERDAGVQDVTTSDVSRTPVGLAHPPASPQLHVRGFRMHVEVSASVCPRQPPRRGSRWPGEKRACNGNIHQSDDLSDWSGLLEEEKDTLRLFERALLE